MMKRNPRLVAGGVASALLGGGVTAALLLGPGASNAATDTTTPAAEEDTTADDDIAVEVPDDPGADLREALQPLIDNGTLTEEQVDAIVASVIDVWPSTITVDGPFIHVGPGFPGGPGGPDGMPRHERMFMGGEVIAEAIGIDEETLWEELRGGATVAEIAEANGVDPQAVIDALVADYTERVTSLVNGESDDSSGTTEDAATDTETETSVTATTGA